MCFTPDPLTFSFVAWWALCALRASSCPRELLLVAGQSVIGGPLTAAGAAAAAGAAGAAAAAASAAAAAAAQQLQLLSQCMRSRPGRGPVPRQPLWDINFTFLLRQPAQSRSERQKSIHASI